MAETVVMTLTEFLLARIAEDEAVAQDIMSAPSWHISPNDFERILDNDGEWVAESMVGTVAHIARHDPARVLAECEAKRRIVEQMQHIDAGVLIVGDGEAARREYRSGALFALCVLAAVYADHEDFRDEWRP